MLCCVVWCCVVLFGVVLCFVVFCCFVLLSFHVTLYCVVWCCVVLCCGVLWCVVLCCVVFRCVVLCCVVLCSFVLCSFVLCSVVLCCGALCCVVLCCVIPCLVSLWGYILILLHPSPLKFSWQATSKKHVSMPFLPLLRPNAPDLLPIWPSGSLIGVPLPNPSFEPETHRWRPGAVAPSREVSSQICAILGQKRPFFAQRAQKPGQKAQAKGNGGYTPRAVSPTRVKEPLGALQLHHRSICPRNGPNLKGARKPQNVRNVHQHPETKHRPYLGLRGSKSDSKGT